MTASLDRPTCTPYDTNLPSIRSTGKRPAILPVSVSVPSSSGEDIMPQSYSSCKDLLTRLISGGSRRAMSTGITVRKSNRELPSTTGAVDAVEESLSAVPGDRSETSSTSVCSVPDMVGDLVLLSPLLLLLSRDTRRRNITSPRGSLCNSLGL